MATPWDGTNMLATVVVTPLPDGALTNLPFYKSAHRVKHIGSQIPLYAIDAMIITGDKQETVEYLHSDADVLRVLSRLPKPERIETLIQYLQTLANLSCRELVMEVPRTCPITKEMMPPFMYDEALIRKERDRVWAEWERNEKKMKWLQSLDFSLTIRRIGKGWQVGCTMVAAPGLNCFRYVFTVSDKGEWREEVGEHVYGEVAYH